MKTRALALFLCLLVLFSACLTGCGEKDEDKTLEASSSRTPTTLVMWVVTDEATTPEAEEAVEKAFNSYTKSNFTTAVDLVFFTEEEYLAALPEMYKQVYNYKSGQPVVTTAASEVETTAPVTTAETVVNDYGVPELKYPEPAEAQLDILLLIGPDMYYQYANTGMLKSMSTTLIDVSKKLNDYIYPSFFDAAKISSGTWAIPNNHAIGEYTYLLVNRELAEKYYIDLDEIHSVEDCLPFLADVAAHENTAPVLAPYACPNLKYWGNDSFSVLASDMTAEDISPKNIFTLDAYTTYLRTTAFFEEKGYYAADADTLDFGIGVVTGKASDLAKYGDRYEVKVLAQPVADEKQLLSSTFGICCYTDYFDRAMEVITALNTVSELRNILQYGVADVTYSLDEKGNLDSLFGNYVMNPNYTGNELIGYYPIGETGADRDAAKQQNLDSLKSPYLPLMIKWHDVDQTILDNLNAYSALVKEEVDACHGTAATASLIQRLRTEVDEADAFVAATNPDNKNSVTAVYASAIH